MSLCRARSISATAFQCGARCRRRVRAWSGRSSFSIISARRNFAPAPASTCARIRISGSPPSPICSTARSCTATASAPQLAIRPGEVNWMTAGRGIVHSERTDTECCAAPAARSMGCRCGWRCRRRKRKWTPAFAHHARRRIPAGQGQRQDRARRGRARFTARRRRCRPRRETMFADVTSARPAARCRSTPDTRSARSMSSTATIDIAGDKFEPGRLLVFKPGDRHHHPTRYTDRAFRHLRRRADGRPAPHLVEFRFIAQGAHRAGQGGMERRPFRQGAGRRDRVHPAAGEIGLRAFRQPARVAFQLLVECRPVIFLFVRLHLRRS